MSFIQSDDYILIMDFDTNDKSLMKGPCITQDDAKRLREAGILTAVKYVPWNLIEPERGVYDWSELDREVEKWNNADCKVLLSTYCTCITWAPDNWYAMNRQGALLRSSLSVFNMEAQNYSNEFIRQVVHRYPQDKVCAFNAQLTHGETIYHNEPAYYDECAKQDYISQYGSLDSQFNNIDSPQVDIWLQRIYLSTLLKQQNEFTQTPHKEIWTALHPAIRMWTHMKGNGNKYFHYIMKQYKVNFPDSIINQILYTYFPHGMGVMNTAVDDAREVGGMQIWAGSEYCEGLNQNTDLHKRLGLRGFLTAPIHPFTKYTAIEDWMLQAIRNTCTKLATH